MSKIKNRTLQFEYHSISPLNEIFSWGAVYNILGQGEYAFQVIAGFVSEPFSVTGGLGKRLAITYFNVELGGLKLLSPGTILNDNKIDQFVHGYSKKRSVFIPDPQNLEIKSLKELLDFSRMVNMPKLESDFKRLPVRVINNYPGYDHLLIPCNVIADYYYFGMPQMIHYMLTDQFGDFPVLNKVYDPTKSQLVTLPDGRRVAYVRLRKEMYNIDAVKIARLALDPVFLEMAKDLGTSLLNKNPSGAFLELRFPITSPTELTFYGRDLQFGDKKVCLMQSIASCSAPVGFDGLIVSRDNPGAAGHGQLNFNKENGEEDNSGNPPPDRRAIPLLIGSNENDGFDKIGTGPAPTNSVDVNEIYFPDQKDNFDLENMITEEAFVAGTGKSSPAFEKFIFNFSTILDHLTFRVNKSGSGKRRRLNLHGKGFPEEGEIPLVTCFQLIKDAVSLLPSNFVITPLIPYDTGKKDYSRFPVEKFNVFDKDFRRKLNFCYINTKANGWKIYKRVFIVEISFGELYFYVMDVQPNETKQEDDAEIKNESNKKRAIVFCNSSQTRIEDFEKILIATVEGKAIWKKFFSEKVTEFFSPITHTNAQSMRKNILDFLTNRRKFKPNP